MEEYDNWVADPSATNLGATLKALEPVINSEVYRYTGPKPLLRSKAKALAVGAIRSYNPDSGAHLKSWVVTQLQPLSRYSQQLRTVKAPEVAIRQSAEVNRVTDELTYELGRPPSDVELADAVGISVKRIKHIRNVVVPSMTEGSTDPIAGDENTSSAPSTNEVNRVPVIEEAVYMSLDDTGKQIFDWKTGKGGKVLSNAEIARRLGISPAAVSQRSANMAEKIRQLYQQGVL